MKYEAFSFAPTLHEVPHFSVPVSTPSPKFPDTKRNYDYVKSFICLRVLANGHLPHSLIFPWPFFLPVVSDYKHANTRWVSGQVTETLLRALRFSVSESCIYCFSGEMTMMVDGWIGEKVASKSESLSLSSWCSRIPHLLEKSKLSVASLLRLRFCLHCLPSLTHSKCSINAND